MKSVHMHVKHQVRVYEKKSCIRGTISGCGCSIEENAVFEGKVSRVNCLESFIGSTSSGLLHWFCFMVLLHRFSVLYLEKKNLKLVAEP